MTMPTPISATIPSDEEYVEATALLSALKHYAQTHESGYAIAHFEDIESLNQFTIFLEYERGAKLAFMRDDLGRMEIVFETKDGAFSCSPGYHLLMEFTPA